MKLSENRKVLLCSKIQRPDVERYLKTKKIKAEWLKETDLLALENEIEQQIQQFRNTLAEESCLTIILYEGSCRLAFSLQQKTQAQLILINPPVNHVFGKETAIIESDDDYQILLTIKHLIETGT